jgi:Domain of unknown function (DUF4365)
VPSAPEVLPFGGPTVAGDSNNALGIRGEALFQAIMTKFHGRGPLFRVSFLGDKWPLVDFLCELEGSWVRQRPFFFVQVKATRRGYTRREHRLKVSVKGPRAAALGAYKVPVYLAGVDEAGERAFIVGVAGRRIGGLTSLHTGTELDVAGRRALWEEVRRYWTNVPRPRRWTTFHEPKWR